MASALGLVPEILNGVYGATKAFVIALTFSLQKELAEKSIRIQAVLPGAVETPFWEASGGSLDRLPDQIVPPSVPSRQESLLLQSHPGATDSLQNRAFRCNDYDADQLGRGLVVWLRSGAVPHR